MLQGCFCLVRARHFRAPNTRLLGPCDGYMRYVQVDAGALDGQLRFKQADAGVLGCVSLVRAGHVRPASARLLCTQVDAIPEQRNDQPRPWPKLTLGVSN